VSADSAGACPEAAWAHQTALDIWTRLASSDFVGWDPYDALNTRLIPESFTKPRIVARLLTQTVKRCPLPLQPLLAVRREVDAYTLGHVLLAEARLMGAAGLSCGRADGTRGHGGDLITAGRQVMSDLRSLAMADGGSLAWGYHFPVRTRFFSYAPTTPNLIVTAFVAKGMIAATRAGSVDCRQEIRGCVDFILHRLPRVSDHTGDCIGYVPGENAVVHNANMLAALVLCEAASLCDDAPGADAGGPWLDQALRCARFTAARQAPDGSWPYSEEPYGRWVDGFHTGFVLEGLAAVVRVTGDTDLAAALKHGVRFYVAQLFGPHGEPKYYPDRALPFDALSAAQGVETLQTALRGTDLGEGASRAVPGQLDWIRDHLVHSGGRVPYQVHRCWTDRREFPRWSSAPLMSALAGVSTEGFAESPYA
jgi:hypothetical protein